ncbi:MAG: hypothetical protein ACO1NS_08875 [Daejeonella sp.]|uniref:hypothetical protein n=1 Tax=Daejeonella sp. JGW-45 TaxID=3034148 RepID=UPI0023EB7CCB|nr:hypothetical protein [Daejeonella sp. JGW-45]
MTTIDSALQEIMRMDYNSREMLLEILQKRQIEARRNDVAKSAKQSLKDYHSGRITPATADEVKTRLNSL